jgi:hypothetical protein
VVGRRGTPLAVWLSAANVHQATPRQDVLDAVEPSGRPRGRPGRPRRRLAIRRERPAASAWRFFHLAFPHLGCAHIFNRALQPHVCEVRFARGQAVPPRAGLGVERRPQLTALFTSAPILASSAALNSVSAKAVGHMAPSSRCAASLKPSVAYRVLNFCALWKKQTTSPSLA